MSQDRPDAIELLRTVREFVDGLRPKLQREEQYHAVVAAYLLGIVERELALSADFDEREKAQLSGFVGAQGSLVELRKSLCEGIRSGLYDERWQELLEMILEQIANKVRVVRPDHLDSIHSKPCDAGRRR